MDDGGTVGESELEIHLGDRIRGRRGNDGAQIRGYKMIPHSIVISCRIKGLGNEREPG